jgi:hypothetical protein
VTEHLLGLGSGWPVDATVWLPRAAQGANARTLRSLPTDTRSPSVCTWPTDPALGSGTGSPVESEQQTTRPSASPRPGRAGRLLDRRGEYVDGLGLNGWGPRPLVGREALPTDRLTLTSVV